MYNNYNITGKEKQKIIMVNKKKLFSCYITVDYEEWYHIEYLKKYSFPHNTITCCDKIDDFIFKLNEENIPTTFFVVSDICNDNIKTLHLILSKNNKIGCHTSSHENLKLLNVDDFKKHICNSKETIEKTLNTTINCFRAPSFSANIEKITSLSEIGFQIDSSYINSDANEFYEKNDLCNWITVQNCIYREPKSNLLEFEIPTISIGKKRIPIAGGGFFRLIPLWILKILIKKFIRKNDYYMFFIHPYEISGIELPISKELPLKYRFRLNYGRKRAKAKFWKLIRYLKKSGAIFKTLGD